MQNPGATKTQAFTVDEKGNLVPITPLIVKGAPSGENAEKK